VVIPEAKDRDIVYQVIFQELCRGTYTDTARTKYLKSINQLRYQGTEGAVLDCTEIPLLVRQQDTDLPLFNNAVLHAQYALECVFE